MTESHPPAPPGSPRPRSRLLKPAVATVVVLAVAGTLVGLQSSQARKETKKDEAARTFEFAPGDLAELRHEPIGRKVPISGSLKPVLSATVRAKVAAEVSRVHVQEGERVAAGQALVSLDAADLGARLDREMAAVAEARARLDLARKNEANNQALLEKAFISRNAYDSVVNTVQVAEANLQSAQAQAAIAKRALDDARVRAPFAGVVARRWVNVGDKVSADSPVAAVVDLRQMELEAQVPVSEVPYVKVGQSVDFRVDGFASRAFAGKVERINPSAEAGSRAISIFVTLGNADGSLRGGMFANGVLDTTEGAPIGVIPASALVEEGGQQFVFVVREGKVERRTVIVGVRDAGRALVEIREGLEKGVPVITVKAEGLKPGAGAVVKAPARPS